jgi:hypothetical protein
MTTDEDYSQIREVAGVFDNSETLQDGIAICSAPGLIKQI